MKEYSGFKVQIQTGNAAFAGDDGAPNEAACGREVARILKRIVHDIEVNECKAGPITDANGNHVGDWEFEE